MKIMKLKVLCCVLAVYTTGAMANSLPASLELVYTVKLGIAELGSLSSKMTKKADYYEVVSETRAEGMASILLGGTVREICRFNVNDNAIKPEHYRIIREGRDAFDWSVSFNWDERRVLFSAGNSVVLSKGYILDNCSVPYALMAGGASIVRQRSLHIVGGKRVRQFKNLNVSEEQISTPVGDFQAIKIEQVRFDRPDKRLTFWIAPERNNLLVKIVEQRKSRPDTTMLLKSVAGL